MSVYTITVSSGRHSGAAQAYVGEVGGDGSEFLFMCEGDDPDRNDFAVQSGGDERGTMIESDGRWYFRTHEPPETRLDKRRIERIFEAYKLVMASLDQIKRTSGLPDSPPIGESEDKKVAVWFTGKPGTFRAKIDE